MKQLFSLCTILMLITTYTACSYHKQQMPDPSAYNAHFPDMDTNQDQLVNWAEFKKHFPNADDKVFKALDMDKDSAVDHDEWHEFKKAHGMKRH